MPKTIPIVDDDSYVRETATGTPVFGARLILTPPKYKRRPDMTFITSSSTKDILMRAKIWPGILTTLMVLTILILPAMAQDQSPIKANIDSPEYVIIPDLSHTDINASEKLSLYFPADYVRCKSHYGEYKYYSACERDRKLTGRKAAAGVALIPAIPGEWKWESNTQLAFTPKGTWPAGQNYTIGINFDALNVPKQVVMSGNARATTITFTTTPLKLSISKMTYMQDPEVPAKKLVTAQVSANYPVDPASLESKIRLEMEENQEGKLAQSNITLKPEIKLDADGRSAWISIPLPELPDEERYLRLNVDAGVTPVHGGQPNTETAHERTRVPSLSTYLTLSNPDAAIARLADKTPAQVVTFQTNVKAKPEDVLKNVKFYLLPAQHPVTKLNKNNGSETALYEWKADSEITPEVLQGSEALTLAPLAGTNKEGTNFTFTFTAPSNRYLYFVADKGLEAFGSYTLNRDHKAILRAPDWPHDLDIMQKGSILTLSGSHKLSLHVRGTDNLKVEVAQIRPEALQHFISQTSGNITNPDFQYNFGKEDIARIDNKDVAMDFQSPQASQYTAFDFSPYLKDGKKGIFLVSFQGYKDKKSVGNSTDRFVLVTDMGFLVKENAYTGRDVFLMSLSTGQPVAGADISILSRNGLAIYTGKAGADGHVALPDFTNSTRDREPVAIVVQKAGDYAFIPYSRYDRQVNTSRFDVDGTMTADDGMKAFLFSDRGIYRPGDTVHLGAIVHNKDWVIPAGLPLRLVVTDPRGRKIRDEVLKFSGPGAQDYTIETLETWLTGAYRASLYVALADNQRGTMLNSTSFRVEEFQPDLLRIKTQFIDKASNQIPATGWVHAGGIMAAVTLTNLYGTPASERRVAGTITLNPGSLSFDQYKDVTFFDSTPAPAKSTEVKLTDSKTDMKGETTLLLDLEKQFAGTYSMTLQTQGFEAGSGKGVTAYATTMVSPMDFAIGLKSADNLSYLRKGADSKITLIAIDPKLARMAVQDLTLELIRKASISSLVKHNDGSYAYETTTREETVKSEAFTVAASDTTLKLPTDELGDFVYRLKTAKGTVVEEIAFAVTGDGQRTDGESRKADLKIAIDKEKYETGEDMEISITAPYAGAGLITLESDHVLNYKWFKTTTTNSVQKISIPKDFAGKGYVNVAFVRDVNSHEIYMDPASYAIVSFTANMQPHTTKIDLTVPNIVKPGEPVTIHYKGNTKGKIFIYAVDEGILQVAKYKTPDPLKYFLLDRALQVSTMQMIDLLMPEYALVRQLSSSGGDADGEGAALGKHLNPFKRKTLAPAVYWSGLVDLDTMDKTVTFTPPGHFNGEMRVMAVAITDTSIGNAEKKMTVQGDVIMTPNTPIFLAPGDESNASVTVSNNVKGSGKDAKLKLSAVTTAGVLVQGLPDSPVTIPEGQEKTFDFILKARDNPGPASITLTATEGGNTQTALATMSVRPATAKDTTLTAGYSDTGNAKIALTRKMYSAFAERELTVSPLPTGYVLGLLRFLDQYPYGCSEQTVSKAFPQLSLFGQDGFGSSESVIKDKVQYAINTLRARQSSDGGFSYWDGENEANAFITDYATEFLTRAREAQIPVPSEMIEGALQYLRENVNRDIDNMQEARQVAYGIYILTNNGMVTSNEILHLLKYFDDQKVDWKTDLSAVYLAASYQMMQQGELASKTLDDFDKGLSADDVKYENWDEYDYSPFIKNARYVSLLARHFPDRLKAMDPKIVFTLATFIQEQRYSTLSSVYAIQALMDYQKVTGKALAANPPKLTADGKPVALETARILQKAPLPVEAQTLELNGPKSSLFYTVSETGFDKTPADKAVTQNMTIERSYQTDDGKPVGDKVAIGTLVDVYIKINAHDNRTISNVAIVDLLPGGFELTLDQPEGSTLSTSFVDRHEDRIIAFGTIKPEETTFRYRMRATTKGKFITPPPYAEAMYDLTTKARGIAGTISITDPAQK